MTRSLMLPALAAAALLAAGFRLEAARAAGQPGAPQATQPSAPTAANTGQASGGNSDEDQDAYKIVNGHVGTGIFHGYLFYGESCLRCHGPDGAGSSYAPSLVDALKSMTKEQFENVVINGKQDVSTSQQLVMPAFGTVADVVLHLNDIYEYLKARAEGRIPRGRPPQIGD